MESVCLVRKCKNELVRSLKSAAGHHSKSFSEEKTTEYTECWPGTLFDILLNKYYPAG